MSDTGPLERRRAGVLLHPTSLPGRHAAGGFGADARRFIDLIADAGFTVWQTLPLGPVDETRSPYLQRSAFAGHVGLVDPDRIAGRDWWQGPAPELGDPRLPAHAWAAFARRAGAEERADFIRFREREARWLLPYALFEVIGAAEGGRAWWDWPAPLRDRDATAVRRVLADQGQALSAMMFAQYLFDQEWRSLRAHAAARGVRLFGDVPFYVDRHSADVWWHRRAFAVDAAGRPTAVAGVPPDYFNADGQLWGNPLFDWDALAADGFRWWIARLGHQARWFDLVRVDHFRALESHWAVPAGAATAREGSWRPTPGAALLERAADELPGLALVAEDLGSITDAVRALRDRFGLPGMLVLQFAFDGSADNPYLPVRHVENAVVYTGTHDNDTTAGWYASLAPDARAYVDQSLGDDRGADALIDAALASPARLAMLPMQDLLGLGSDARMNRPGTVGGNWAWRFDWGAVPADFAATWRARVGAAAR